jgi:hypothetical protein
MDNKTQRYKPLAQVQLTTEMTDYLKGSIQIAQADVKETGDNDVFGWIQGMLQDLNDFVIEKRLCRKMDANDLAARLMERYLIYAVLGKTPAEMRTVKTNDIYRHATQYILYGTVLDWLTQEQGESMGLTKRYFMWLESKDLKKFTTAPEGETITKENIDNYKCRPRPAFAGWRREQLMTVVKAKVIPYLLQKLYGFSVDLNSKTYNRIFENPIKLKEPGWNKFEALKKWELFQIVKDYITHGEEGVLIKYKEFTVRGDAYSNKYRFVGQILSAIKSRHDRRMKHIWKVLDDKVGKQLRDVKKTKQSRFKWQTFCKADAWSTGFEESVIRDLAEAEGIRNSKMKTKRELCVDLAQRFEELVKKKDEAIPTCTNTQTIGLDALKDVPAEFFYTYTVNNKIFCEDIRVFYKHLTQYGAKNPWDRTELPQSIVDDAITKYETLEVLNTMEDIDISDDETLPTPASSILSAKTAEFLGMLVHPNPADLFIDAPEGTFLTFARQLKEELLINNVELRQVLTTGNLQDKKMLLLQMLITKISNDVRQDGVSAVAVLVSEVYNGVFTRL